jgi:hypothetical protein
MLRRQLTPVSSSGGRAGGSSKLEQPPRRPLSFGLTRRELFGSLRSELERRTADERRPAYKLTMLGALPDEQLARIVPALVPGARLSIDDGAVWGRPGPDALPRRLFAAERATLAVLEAIDGWSSLGAIAEALRRNSGEPVERSFARVRSVFLDLVVARLAVPT